MTSHMYAPRGTASSGVALTPKGKRYCEAVRKLTRAEQERIIQAMIEALDLDDGDPDSEPTLGAPETWVSTYGFASRTAEGAQWDWADGSSQDGEFEETNEDGGDILDEPHDYMDEDGCEPSLGWAIPTAETVQGMGYTSGGDMSDRELDASEAAE